MAFWRKVVFVRSGDVVWLALFSAMAAARPQLQPPEILILCCLAILQVLEPRIPGLLTIRGNVVSVLLKLALGYLLIGFTGGVTSSYYLILLLPVVSAATTMGIIGTVGFMLLACASYLSYLLPVFFDWTLYTIPSDQARELLLRLVFLLVVGFLTHQLAKANRIEALKYQAAARQLEAANTSLREAEAAMRRTERLAALGQLSAGLAHELRNPLGTIRASAEVLLKNTPKENAVAREVAGFISSEVDRTNSLVTRFLEFARPMELRLHEAELSEVIDRVVAQLGNSTSPANVTIYKNLSPDIRPFLFDAELMERVMDNLLMNAAQATPPGGTVTVKTRPVDGDVEISVIDRGTGIDPKHLESIFNPFFTTKPEGVGLGLAIVSKIVDEHGGKMAVESDLGKGTVFRLLLPTHRKK